MKLEFLQTLGAVIESGSFAAAAAQVHLTPSAVGLQIRQLEQWFGQPLFDRSARHVRPTAFAREVAQTVEGTLRDLHALRARRSAPVAGTVRLGTVESTQISLLPVALAELRSRAPALQVQFIRGTSDFLLGELKSGRLDAAVLVRPPAGGSSRLHWVVLMREVFVMVAPRATRRRTPEQLLQAYQWIRLDRSTTGGLIASRFVERLVPRLRSAIEIPGTEAIVALVASGLGVSVIPKLRRELLESWPVDEISLGRNAPSRQIAFVCRAADAEAQRIGMVLEAFQEAVVKRALADARPR